MQAIHHQLWLAIAYVSLTASLTHAQQTVSESNKYALLIGCTVYPNLDEKFHLIGPANDVVLARSMLVDRFEFADENVVTLADAEDDNHQPTRANITREWQALIDKAKRGDQLVVLMGGHGTQAPQGKDSDDDPEPDGMDEMFLPKDVGPWDDTAGEVSNGIKDDEIRGWIAALKEKGADLFLIVDACHSGTMTRDAGDEIKRELRPEQLGVPKEVLEAVAANAGEDADPDESQLFDKESTRAIGDAPQPVDPNEPVLIALYAAQSIEPTVEKKMPQRGKDRKYYGLLTYTMNEILSQAESKLTYRELAQQIQRKYVKWGRTSPTPVLEGTGLDREVFGLLELPDRPDMLIAGSRFSGYKVNAGTLKGITADSILAVFPAAGAADADKPIGHVKVLKDDLTAVEAAVEPCEYNDMPAPAKLSSGLRCQAVYVQLNDPRLRVAVDPQTDEGEDVLKDDVEILNEDLSGFVDENQHLVEAVDTVADSDWVIRYDNLKDKGLFLSPVSGWAGKEEGELPPLFGPAPQDDDEFYGWFNESLTRIARVNSLLRIAGDAGDLGSESRIEVSIGLREGQADKKGTPIAFERGGIKLHNRDRVVFRVKNVSQEPVDVTMLVIDSGYGIHPIYPTPGETNRLYPGNEYPHFGVIDASTTGMEHLIVIGMKGKAVDSPVNFSFLAQPTIERTRALEGENPLARVLGSAQDKTRGFASEEIDGYEIVTLTWRTLRETRPE